MTENANQTYGQQASDLRVIMRALGIGPHQAVRVWHLACAQAGGECLSAWAVSALIVPDCTKLPRRADSF
jgi:hypothetical protein